MDRGVVVALVALGVVLAGVIGAGVGFVVIVSDPLANPAAHCHAMSVSSNGPPAGPPPAGTCRNFRVVDRTTSRVDYTYDLPDGSHCVGYTKVDRRDFLGLPTSSSGGAACAPAGQPIPRIGAPAAPTPFADGNPPCAKLSYAGPRPTAAGFEVLLTNPGPSTCDVGGPAKVVFLGAGGQMLSVANQPAAEPAPDIALAPQGSARLDFDAGAGPCVSATAVVVAYRASSPPLPWSGQVCGPVISHAARAGA